MPGPPLPGRPVLAGNGKKPLRPSQAPLSLTFFEKKVSKEAFNISTKKHLLAGHTHTGQQVLLFTI